MTYTPAKTAFQIQQPVGPLVVVYCNQTLPIGTLLIFDEQYTGFVTQQNTPYFTVNIQREVTVTTVRLKNWWQPKHPKTTLLATPEFFRKNLDTDQESQLFVPATLPANHVPGTLGWALYYQAARSAATVLLVQGNDYRTPGVCSYKFKGQWRPGIYTLVARRYYKQGYLKQSEDFVTWIVSQPVEELSSNTGDLSCDGLNLT